MKKITLPYEDTGYFNKAVIDYLHAVPELAPFYSFPPSVGNIENAIANRNQYPVNREVLFQVLMRQHKNFMDSSSNQLLKTNIASVLHPNAFTVTAAHQPNIFLGPLYVIYKIISAINLSKRLNEKFSSFRFIPVFWLGSEDHDQKELNHIHAFGKTITWQTNQQGAFGRMETHSVAGVIDEMKQLAGNAENVQKCMQLLEACYLNEPNMAAAAKKLIYHFFASDGLVIIDADDEELKRAFLPVMEKELLENISFKEVTSSNRLFEKHYKPQVLPQEINLFYLSGNIRERIEKENHEWRVRNTPISFSQEKLLKELHDHPGHFSPNVILRPVYQEMILPNVAFIGGGAEVTYYLQLKSLFEVLHVAFPLVMLRNSVLWIDKANAARLQKLDISVEDIFQHSADRLIRQYIQKKKESNMSLEIEKEALLQLYEQVLWKVIKEDGSLKASAEAEKVKSLKLLESLEEKLHKSARKKEEAAVNQIKMLKEKLFPENLLQERYDNFLPYYIKYGNSFFDNLKNYLDPTEKLFTILEEE